MPLIPLAIIAGGSALTAFFIGDAIEETGNAVEKNAGSFLAIAALGLAGLVVWKMVK
ncbi:MAG: hypothetical protein JKY94_01945 [Rhodobacteraceae bacterium]|nr:hypothetical protein [Paracoccaceae bacterium]